MRQLFRWRRGAFIAGDYFISTLLLTWLLVRGSSDSGIIPVTEFLIAAIVSVAFIVIIGLNNGYSLAQFRSPVRYIIIIGKSAFATVTLYAILALFEPNLLAPLSHVIMWTLGVILIVPPLRIFITWSFKLEEKKLRVLVLGAGWAGREFARVVAKASSTGYKIAGFIDDEKVGEFIEGRKVFGGFRDAVDLTLSHNIDIAVMAITYNRPDHVINVRYQLERIGIPVMEMYLLYEEVTKRVPVQHIRDRWLFPAGTGPNSRSLAFEIAERFGNLFVALILLILSSPVWLLAAITIKLTSRGPIFFSQERVGFLNKPYICIKFRSMIHNAEAETGAVWASDDDPRITVVGKILRHWRLDELPQLLNVIKGDMNIAGPRPERPEFVEELAAEIPFYNRRHLVKPGITGWAQVNYRYTNNIEDTLTKLQYDLYYIKHRSFFLELFIALRTIGVIFSGKGV